MFTTSLRRRTATVLLAVLACFSILAFGSDDAGRKLKIKVTPTYPEVAKNMHVSGAVRLEVLVAANGSVKSVKALGGHPLLIDAAVSAVKQWKYEAGDESTRVVEINFTPAQ